MPPIRPQAPLWRLLFPRALRALARRLAREYRLSKGHTLRSVRRLYSLLAEHVAPAEVAAYDAALAASGYRRQLGRAFAIAAALTLLVVAAAAAAAGQIPLALFFGLGATLSAADLAKQKIIGTRLGGPFDFLGKLAFNFSMLVWGSAGSGKSTWSLAFAAEWARRVCPVLYVSAEEAHGSTFAERLTRLGATVDGLHILAPDSEKGLAQIVSEIERTGAQLVVFDSISWIDPNSRQFGELARALQENGIALIYIAHARKGGRNYLGPSRIGHAVDTVVQVADGVAVAKKNRFAPLGEAPVPFTKKDAIAYPDCDCVSCGDCGGAVRSNPAHSGSCAYATGGQCECSCGGKYHGSQITEVAGNKGTNGAGRKKQTKQGKAVMASLTERGTKKTSKGTKRTTKRASTTSKGKGRTTSAAKKAASSGGSSRGGLMAKIAAAVNNL